MAELVGRLRELMVGDLAGVGLVAQSELWRLRYLAMVISVQLGLGQAATPQVITLVAVAVLVAASASKQKSIPAQPPLRRGIHKAFPVLCS